MAGPVGVMAIILLETAVGGAVVLWAIGVWGVVRRGFFLLTGIIVALCALGAWSLASAGVQTAEAVIEARRPPSPAVTDRTTVPASGPVQVDRDQRARASLQALAGPPGRRMLAGLGSFASLAALWQLLLLLDLRRASRVAGLAATASGMAALVLVGLARGIDVAVAVAELALGALFLGSTVVGLLLGHWYLVERRLTNAYMIRTVWWYLAGVVAAVGAAALSARNPAPELSQGFSPVLAVPGFSVLLAGGLVAVCALIAGFVWKLAREGGRSIQAATGMFYLAVIMALSAEMASKLGFF
ncbi:MAG: hypothetical protein M3N52_13915 [Actinomycetota bacterium]|nr:hypothetical protein [Actinomycetota bacterium]